MDLIDRQEVISALEKVAGFFHYKEPGNRDSYNEYNEAWNDAIGRAEMEIGKLPSAQKTRQKGASNVDKAIWTMYENIPHLMCVQPYGDIGRYLTYYAEERLYLVFDRWYHGFYLVEARNPKDAIDAVNCDKLNYLPKGEE